MTPRQCEIAAESYTASLLSRCGFDVSVQYGANQPHYDLIAEKDGTFIPISVKGSQDGGWALAVKYKKGRSYHEAIDEWLKNQRDDIVFIFVQFYDVKIGEVPRVYVATPMMISEQMKTQCNGNGHGALHEDVKRKTPKSKYNHRIPTDWQFEHSELLRNYKG